MKKLPKEFVLTNFTNLQANEVVNYHFNGLYMIYSWNYVIIKEPKPQFVITLTEDMETLPKISYKEWKEIVSQESFPEKWFIYVTEETRDVLNNWRKTVATEALDDTLDFVFNDEKKMRMYSHDISNDGSFYDVYQFEDNHKDYTEITFEQFKKYVLKESDVVEDKSYKIDYNQLRELYDNANIDGRWFLENKFECYGVFAKFFHLNNGDIDSLRGCVNKEVCDKIFGKLIDFDKLQVGSKVELNDGTIGRIVILNSNKYLAGNTLKMKWTVKQQWQVVTLLIHDKEFRAIDHKDFLKEIKTVIEY